MDIQVYETFLELAKTLNFRQTSKNLNVAQSTVSNRIQALEEAYQTELFNRSSKKVTLTHAGQMVEPYAGRIVKLHKEALKACQQGGRTDKALDVTIDRGIHSTLLLDITRLFGQENPTVALKMTRDQSKNILKGVLDGLIDIGLVYNKSEGLQVEFIPFEKDMFVFAVDKDLMKDSQNQLNENIKHEVQSQIIVDHGSIHKNSILKFDLVGADYGNRFRNWLSQMVPAHYGYHIELSGGVNPVDHIAGQGRAGFVLKSDIERSMHGDQVDTLNIEDVEMPYFQSHIIYSPSSPNISNIMKFVDALNRQKK